MWAGRVVGACPAIFIMITAILVALLGHDSFPVREAAESSLERLAPLAWSALAAGELSADPEVSMRSGRILGGLRVVWITPYLDALPDDYPDRYAVIARLVRKATEAGYPAALGSDWPAYRQATVYWLAEGGSTDLLQNMRRRTINYDLCRQWEIE